MKTSQSIFTIIGFLVLGLMAQPLAQDESTIDDDGDDGETVFVQVHIPPSPTESLA